MSIAVEGGTHTAQFAEDGRMTSRDEDRLSASRAQRIDKEPVTKGQKDEEHLRSLDESESSSYWLDNVLNEARAQTSNVDSRPAHDSHSSTHAGSLLTLDATLSHLSTTLTIARQDTLAHMDVTMANVTATMPRLSLELRLMRDAALTLRSHIAQLRQEAIRAGIVDQADAQENGASDPQANLRSKDATNAVLQRLAALHSLHARMSAARDVLGLAESWSTLSTDVNAFLAETKYDAAAARIAKAKSSLVVFERTPEYEQRKHLLDTLAGALEMKMNPILVDAIRDRDVEQVKRLFDILANVDRQAQMTIIWQKTRSEECLREWTRLATGTKSDDTQKSGAAAASLRKFADALTTLLEEENKIAPQITSNDCRIGVEGLVCYVLSKLEPTLSTRLSLLIDRDQHLSDALLRANEIHDALLDMSTGIASCLAKAQGSGLDIMPSMLTSPLATPAYAQQSSALISPEIKPRPNSLQVSGPSSTATPGHARRISIRKANVGPAPSRTASASLLHTPSPGAEAQSSVFDAPSQWKGLLNCLPATQEWERMLFEPMLDYQMDYRDLEKANLARVLEGTSNGLRGFKSSIEMEKGDETILQLGSDLSLTLKTDIDHAVEAIARAAKRARSFTFGLGCDSLIDNADEVLAALVSRNKTALDERTIRASEAAHRLTKASSNVNIESGATSGEAYFDAAIGASEASSSAQRAIWKAFEEGMGIMASLSSVAGTVRSAELAIARQHVDLAEFLLTPVGSSDVTRDALNKVCSTASGSSTAAFRLLLEANQDRLRTGSLIKALISVRNMSSQATQRSSTSVAQSMPLASDSASTLFSQARLAILSQVRAVQRHLTNVILSPLMPNLEMYATMSIWAADRLPGSVNEYDLAMPTFSLSPTEDMSRIGEALLDLPRLLEVWSDQPQFRWGVQGLAYHGDGRDSLQSENVSASDGMDFTIISTPDDLFEKTVTSPKKEKRQSMLYVQGGVGGGAGTSTNHATSPTLDRRSMGHGAPSSHRHTPSVAAIATLPARGEQSKRQEDERKQYMKDLQQQEQKAQEDARIGLNAQSALQSYLTSISMTLVSHFVSMVLPSMERLSGPGASQLAADLEYLSTILSALNVTQAGASAVAANTATDDVEAAQSHLQQIDDVTLLVRTLEAWRDVCRIKDQDGRRLRYLARTGQAARGVVLGADKVEGFTGDEDRLRSLLATQAFDMISRMRAW